MINILLIGAVPYEPHVDEFIKEHNRKEENVFTLDIIDYRHKNHFKCNFNDHNDIYNVLSIMKKKNLYFDAIIFDVNVIKFVSNQYIFQMLLIFLNQILKTRGSVYFECCLSDSLAVDTRMAKITVNSLDAIPYYLKKSFELRSNKKDIKNRWNHELNQQMINDLISKFLPDYGFEGYNILSSEKPYPLTNKDIINRYIIAIKVDNPVELINFEHMDNTYYFGYYKDKTKNEPIAMIPGNMKLRDNIVEKLQLSSEKQDSLFLFGINDQTLTLSIKLPDYIKKMRASKTTTT